MTTDSKKQKQELGAAIKQYLSQAEMHPIQEALELTKFGDFAFVFGMSVFIEEEDKDLVYFLVPADAELKLMGKIDKIFNSQVGPRTVRSQLNRTVEEIGEFPFSTNEKEEKFNDKLFKLLNFHFERQYDAIVPLYQIECSVKFPLANAVLHPSGSQSELSQIAEDESNYLSGDDREQIKNCSYLKFRVTGDSESRIHQVEHEVEMSLQVLRFLIPWKKENKIVVNPVNHVAMRKHSHRIIAFHRVDIGSLPYADVPDIHFKVRPINEGFLTFSRKSLGLGDVNFHYQNRYISQVSPRICRSLSYYDSASRSLYKDVALGNYVICVDILLPPGKSDKLAESLKRLLFYGLRSIYKDKHNGTDSDSKEYSWQSLCRQISIDFKKFYVMRDKIVHGHPGNNYDIKERDVGQIRHIAQLSIHAYSYLARAFNWQTDKEAKDWFKKPCKPPEKNSP